MPLKTPYPETSHIYTLLTGCGDFRIRHIRGYTRDQGCSERPNRGLGQVFQPAVPEDRFQHDTGVLNQPVLEITAFTPATTGPS
jgi:hypothetical protein